MKTLLLKPHCIPSPSLLRPPNSKSPNPFPFSPAFSPKHLHPKAQSSSESTQAPLSPVKAWIADDTQKPSEEESPDLLPSGFSRLLLLSAASVGFTLLLAAADEQRAWAFGPEGPLVEEFWDNMRRYGLYILTVSTGALYTIFLPIFELLKNPISAILIVLILVGGFYLVSQVLNAMVGINEFAYDYAY